MMTLALRREQSQGAVGVYSLLVGAPGEGGVWERSTGWARTGYTAKGDLELPLPQPR